VTHAGKVAPARRAAEAGVCASARIGRRGEQLVEVQGLAVLAGKALAGILARSAERPSQAAELAYRHADAMLAQRQPASAPASARTVTDGE
jgi:hypothetical protein